MRIVHVAFFTSALTLASCGQREEIKPMEPVDLSASARSACMQFLTDRLHDPSSVDWGEYWDWPTKEADKGAWSVQMKFRARNSFGALTQQQRICKVTNVSKDQWSLAGLESLSSR